MFVLRSMIAPGVAIGLTLASTTCSNAADTCTYSELHRLSGTILSVKRDEDKDGAYLSIVIKTDAPYCTWAGSSVEYLGIATEATLHDPDLEDSRRLEVGKHIRASVVFVTNISSWGFSHYHWHFFKVESLT